MRWNDEFNEDIPYLLLEEKVAAEPSDEVE